MSVSYRWNDHKDSNDQDPQAYIENQGICRLKHPTGAQQEIHHKGRGQKSNSPNKPLYDTRCLGHQRVAMAEGAGTQKKSKTNRRALAAWKFGRWLVLAKQPQTIDWPIVLIIGLTYAELHEQR